MELARLLEPDLAELPAAAQLMCLRLLRRAALRPGHVAASVRYLQTSTGLSRNTVRAALRLLRDRALVRPQGQRRLWTISLLGWSRRHR